MGGGILRCGLAPNLPPKGVEELPAGFRNPKDDAQCDVGEFDDEGYEQHENENGQNGVIPYPTSHLT